MTEKSIQISPALSRVFRRHFDGDYFLQDVVSIINRYRSKEISILAIKERYGLYFQRALLKYKNDPTRLENTRKWRLSVHNLVVDLRGLSHTDFDILTHFKKDEAMQRPIQTIDKKQIILSKED